MNVKAKFYKYFKKSSVFLGECVTHLATVALPTDKCESLLYIHLKPLVTQILTFRYWSSAGSTFNTDWQTCELGEYTTIM